MKIGVGDPLRRAIDNSALSLNALGKRSRLNPSSLSRFVREERDLRLSSAWKIADTLNLDLTLIRFLRNAATVTEELEEVVLGAGEQIKVIGSKSRHEPYLAAIETAVKGGSVWYDRLLCGKDISHQLHTHLRRLIDHPKVTVRTTKKPYFGNLTVTDHDCVLVLPAPQVNEFYGIRFTGHTQSLRFSDYFSTVFQAYKEASDQVQDEARLRGLCEKECPERI